ncbi:cytochrome P450 [Hymenobacter saemangeumensis]
MSSAALRRIPGSLGMPLVGDTLGFLTRPVDLFNKKQRRYGNVFKARLFGRTGVYLLGAEANKFVLVEQARSCSSQEGWRFPIGELFHGGLMLRDGEEHKQHRGILQAAFKKEPMRQYLEVMAPIVDRRLAAWGEQTPLRVFPAVKALTLELAGKVFFDLDFSQDLASLSQAMADLVAAATTLVPFNLPFTQYRRGMKGRQLLQEYFGRVLHERRQAPATDMLSHLSQAEDADGRRLTDAEIVDHLIFFLMAAHDTTASTLTSMVYELAAHPEWQDKVRAESQAVCPGPAGLEPTHLPQLEQLGYVMDESLRLHPPLILIPRYTTQELVYEGYTIPAHTHVSVLLYHNHRTPTHWSAPDQFDPLRFAAGRAEHRKCPFGYAPFGAGQHFCLGFAFAEMQVKLVMHHLLRRFRWQLPAGYQVEFASIPIQHPKDGLPIVLETV